MRSLPTVRQVSAARNSLLKARYHHQECRLPFWRIRSPWINYPRQTLPLDAKLNRQVQAIMAEQNAMVALATTSPTPFHQSMKKVQLGNVLGVIIISRYHPWSTQWIAWLWKYVGS